MQIISRDSVFLDINKGSYGSFLMRVMAGYNRVPFTLAKAVCVVNNKFLSQM